MKLSAETAVDKAIEHWKWLSETGAMYKESWPGLKGLYPYDDCFLCEYAEQKALKVGKHYICTFCPYKRHFQITCVERPSSYPRWRDARTQQQRKRYAQEFVEQLLEIREGLKDK